MTSMLGESEGLLRTVFQEMIGSAVGGWASLELLVTGIGSGMDFTARAIVESGGQSTYRLGTDGTMACLELRKVMYRPDSGTWYTARFTVDEVKKCDVEYDYDTMPEDREILMAHGPGMNDELREILVEDHEMFPRDQEYLPGWHPCRLPS
jgi:hypothetical protein